MGMVTCHVGMGVGDALGMAELVRKHLLQRVLRGRCRERGRENRALGRNSSGEDGYTGAGDGRGQQMVNGTGRGLSMDDVCCWCSRAAWPTVAATGKAMTTATGTQPRFGFATNMWAASSTNTPGPGRSPSSMM